MNLYFDTEFTGLHKDATLISIGIVSEDNKKFYAEFVDFDREQIDEWINANVLENLILPKLYGHGSHDGMKKIFEEWKQDGYIIQNLPVMYTSAPLYCTAQTKDGVMSVVGDRKWISEKLSDWLSQFDSIQFVSDVCHYDFVLLIDLFGTAWDLPENVSPVCHDINYAIAGYYGISEKEAFDKSREEIVKKLCGYEIAGKKHNALYDAEIIKAIYDRIYCAG